jgi:hypothetical protein
LYFLVKTSTVPGDVKMKNPAASGGVSSLEWKFIILAGVHTPVTRELNFMRRVDTLNRPKGRGMYPSRPINNPGAAPRGIKLSPRIKKPPEELK